MTKGVVDLADVSKMDSDLADPWCPGCLLPERAGKNFAEAQRGERPQNVASVGVDLATWGQPSSLGALKVVKDDISGFAAARLAVLRARLGRRRAKNPPPVPLSRDSQIPRRARGYP